MCVHGEFPRVPEVRGRISLVPRAAGSTWLRVVVSVLRGGRPARGRGDWSDPGFSFLERQAGAARKPAFLRELSPAEPEGIRTLVKLEQRRLHGEAEQVVSVLSCPSCVQSQSHLRFHFIREQIF